MYTSFRIQNFKGFKDLTFDDLARVNLIAGKNNTGKTSVLEAIALRSGDLDLRNLVRGSNRSDEAKHIDVSLLFHDSSEDNKITFFAETDSRTNNSEEDYPRLVLEGPREGYRELLSAIQGISQGFRTSRGFIAKDAKLMYVTQRSHPSLEIEQSHISGFIIDNVAEFEIINEMTDKIPVLFVRTKREGNNDLSAEWFSNLDISNSTDLLVQALQIIEPRLQQVKLIVKSGRPLLYGDIGANKLLPLAAMGEGMIRVNDLILAISAVKNGVLLIDEIENGLHYSVLPDVWRAINEASKLFNVQVFATTHSREVIAAAHEVFSGGEKMQEGDDYDFRYHRLNRRVDSGDIVLTTYAPEILEASFSMNVEVR